MAFEHVGGDLTIWAGSAIHIRESVPKTISNNKIGRRSSRLVKRSGSNPRLGELRTGEGRGTGREGEGRVEDDGTRRSDREEKGRWRDATAEENGEVSCGMIEGLSRGEGDGLRGRCREGECNEVREESRRGMDGQVGKQNRKAPSTCNAQRHKVRVRGERVRGSWRSISCGEGGQCEIKRVDTAEEEQQQEKSATRRSSAAHPAATVDTSRRGSSDTPSSHLHTDASTPRINAATPRHRRRRSDTAPRRLDANAPQRRSDVPTLEADALTPRLDIRPSRSSDASRSRAAVTPRATTPRLDAATPERNAAPPLCRRLDAAQQQGRRSDAAPPPPSASGACRSMLTTTAVRRWKAHELLLSAEGFSAFSVFSVRYRDRSQRSSRGRGRREVEAEEEEAARAAKPAMPVPIVAVLLPTADR
ncbi:hypothetical protein DFH09DRAFT_1273297 [Mycena vulgaris]|nr:hypothetical protein DFH09DRAFT_1273297 [Mycena vulgaris]